MAKNTFIPINYIPRDNIINYDEKDSSDLVLDDEYEDNRDIITNNYIYDYLD